MKRSSSGKEVRNRLLWAILLFLLVFIGGSLGYYFLSPKDVPFLDCFYMTAISLSTVGYGEIVPVTGHPHLMVFTSLLLFVGVAVLTYSFGVVTAFFVEGTLTHVFWRSKMEHRIQEMSNHFIVCGGGETGVHAIHELRVSRRDVVVIDSNASRFESVKELDGICWVEGDATNDAVLTDAGINRAAGLLACLPSDRDNLFLVISARQMNSRFRIVAKCVDPENKPKFIKAGADSCVSPQVIGGLRLVSELIRPSVVSFLDLMLRETDRTIRIEEVRVSPSSELVNHSLKEASIRQRYELQVLAMKPKDAPRFDYNPASENVIREGTILVVLGETEKVEKLRQVGER